MRKDYIKRLIDGVRFQIKASMAKDPICKKYPGAISSKWVDADLLCLVIEDEVLSEPMSNEMSHILNELADLVEFAEYQENAGLVDGACDPSMNVVRSVRILDQHLSDWRKTEFAEQA